MRLSILTALWLTSGFLTGPLNAGVCRSLHIGVKEDLWRLRVNWRKYRAEVRELGFMRILAYGPGEPKFVDQRWAGLLSPSNPATLQLRHYLYHPLDLLNLHVRLITESAWGSPYEARPIAAALDHSVWRFNDWATKKVFKKTLRPSAWITFPSGFLLIGVAFNKFFAKEEEVFQNAKVEKGLSQLALDAETFVSPLTYQHPYADLKKMILSSPPDRMDYLLAITEVQSRQKAIAQFTALGFQFDADFSDAAVQDLMMGSVLATHVRALYHAGIPDTPQYRKLDGFHPTLDKSQIASLLSLTFVRYLFYTYVEERVYDRLPQKAPPDSLSEKLERMLQTPYSQKILNRLRSGELTADAAIFALQKYWGMKIEFTQNRALHIEELLENADGSYSEEPYTIDHVAAEIEAKLPTLADDFREISGLAKTLRSQMENP